MARININTQNSTKHAEQQDTTDIQNHDCILLVCTYCVNLIMVYILSIYFTESYK